MPLILAIEPDPRQAAQITAIARNRVGAELRLAATTEQALDVIGDRVPDLVLVPALLSPQDDAALAAALRVIAAAAHVRTLTIPVLASGVRHTSTGGMLAKWRKSKPEAPAPDGCDPAVFAEEISSYLREAAAERECRQSLSVDEESSVADEPMEAAATTNAAVEAMACEPAAAFTVDEPQSVQPSTYTEPQFFDERPDFDERPLFEQRPAFEERLVVEEQQVFEQQPVFEDEAIFEERPILFGRQFDDEPLVASPDFFRAIAAPEENLPDVTEPPVVESEPIARQEVNASPAAVPSPVIETTTLEELAEEEADDSLTVSVEPSFADQEPVIPSAAPWIEFDLSDELGDGDEPVFELEAGDATAMLFEDPAFAAFAAPPSKPAAPIARPVEADFERRLAAYAEPAEEEGDTIAEIFAALSNVDQFIVRDEPQVPAVATVSIAPARHVEFFAPTGLTGYRWPPLEGIAVELVDRREHKTDATAAATPPPAVVAATARPARPAQKTESHKADRPEWSELIASLRQDIERLRGGNQAPAPLAATARASQPAPPLASTPGAEPGSTKPKARGPKPIQDEWGFFDPEQCGFAALVAKLSEITDTSEETELHAH